jgi:hypothetical protein
MDYISIKKKKYVLCINVINEICILGKKRLIYAIAYADMQMHKIRCLIMTCFGQEIDNSNDLHSSNDKNIELEIYAFYQYLQFASLLLYVRLNIFFCS